MSKPRTNYDAAHYWAQSMLLDESPAAAEANSVAISTRRVPIGRAETGEQVWAEKTVVTSFGWYPMGVIVRDPDGRVVRVVTNTDRFPNKGHASTPTDQGNVDACAHEAVYELNKRRPKAQQLEVEALPLTDSHLPPLPVTPRADDPEPSISRREIPRVFYASDPGPEPVDDGVGCIAGQSEWYEYSSHVFLPMDIELATQDQAYVEDLRLLSRHTWKTNGSYVSLRSNGAGVDTLTYVSGEEWQHRNEIKGTVKRCPHCAKFAQRHRLWDVEMNGGWHPTTGRRVKGYALYCELLDRHGSIEGWRDEWRAQGKREYADRALHRAWSARNTVPLEAVSKDQWGLPIMRDGYAMRKDCDTYLRRQRELERQERRRQREAEARERERRQVERFQQRVRRLREGRDPFMVAATNVVNTLASIRTSNDSQENADA